MNEMKELKETLQKEIGALRQLVFKQTDTIQRIAKNQTEITLILSSLSTGEKN